MERKRGLRIICKEELRRHNKEGDLWVSLHGKVYDLTKFLEDHPGGPDVLLSSAGEDITDPFEEVMHTMTARETAQNFLIGKLEGYEGPEDEIFRRGQATQQKWQPKPAVPAAGGRARRRRWPVGVAIVVIAVVIGVSALTWIMGQ